MVCLQNSLGGGRVYHLAGNLFGSSIHFKVEHYIVEPIQYNYSTKLTISCTSRIQACILADYVYSLCQMLYFCFHTAGHVSPTYNQNSTYVCTGNGKVTTEARIFSERTEVCMF